MARVKSSTKDTSSANLGFEATARRRSANSKGEAIPRSLEGNLWQSADTALRNNAFLHTGGTLQVMTERQDNFRKDDDVRWQPSGARQPKRSGDSPACFISTRSGQTAEGNPQGERGGVHQFGVPPKTAMRDSAIFKSKGTLRVVSEAMDNNANFAWVQHFIHEYKSRTFATLRDTLLPKLLSGELSIGVEKHQLT